jgi:demethylmenaquinone methyltransferase/2-methoxy-6-polyprenyl-1,4-benzoquinol methylase
MLPARVADAISRAAELGFAQSSQADVGRLLGVLAAAVPMYGRILEIGTGVGVATAWLVEGLGHRADAQVVTIELDGQLSEAAAADNWPAWVRFEVGDALQVVRTLGQFELVFADATAGKWYGLEMTIEALAVGGILVVDDMAPPFWADEEHEFRTKEVRETLLRDDRLTSVEIAWSSGLIISARSFA